MLTRKVLPTALLLLMAAGLVGEVWAAQQASTKRVSVDSLGAQGIGDSEGPSISAHGRFVAFYSSAANLVGSDTNGARDVFVRDRKTGRTTRVSVDSHGAQGNGDSGGPAISADGRFVAFYSDAANLVAGDTNGMTDVFVRDRKTRKTTRVSVNSHGAQTKRQSIVDSISAHGRFVTFDSTASNLVGGDTNGVDDVFVRDRKTGKTTRASVDSHGAQANGESFAASISADGRFVAFLSSASNLVGNDTNGARDVFVRDRKTGRTTRVSIDSHGAQGKGASFVPSISANGRFVAFSSVANNLVAGDTNTVSDVFVRDRKTGRTRRVSVDSHGAQGNGDSTFTLSISADGRFVAFYSDAANLVAGDGNAAGDVFVRDRKTGKTRRVSVASHGTQGNDTSFAPSISANGRFVAFTSLANNLVAGDTNGASDIFARGPLRP